MDYNGIEKQACIDLNFPPASPLRVPASESSDSESAASMISDSGSSISGSGCDLPSFAGENGLLELPEGDKIHGLIKKRLLSSLDPIGNQYEVVSILRNGFGSMNRRAKLHAFHIFAKAVEQKNGGNGNVKYGWCAVKKENIRDILEHGFGEPTDGGFHGRGLYLSPDNAPQESLRSSTGEEDGQRLLLLCRVILGRSEEIRPYSGQSCPSSPGFDSGVDCLQCPRKYIVWSTHMNTHVLPEILVCFRAPPDLGSQTERQTEAPKRPNSAYVPLPALMSEMSKCLSPPEMRVVLKHYKEHKGRKISRHELVRRVRRIAGDELLKEIINNFKDKTMQIQSRVANVQRW